MCVCCVWVGVWARALCNSRQYKRFSFLLTFHLALSLFLSLKACFIMRWGYLQLSLSLALSLSAFVLSYIFLYCHQQQNYLSILCAAFTIYTPLYPSLSLFYCLYLCCYCLKGSSSVTASVQRFVCPVKLLPVQHQRGEGEGRRWQKRRLLSLHLLWPAEQSY